MTVMSVRNRVSLNRHLAGEDSSWHTIYLEEDGITAHRHKFKESCAFLCAKRTQSDTTADTIISLLKNIDQKLDVLLKERDRENNILDNW